MENLDTNLLFEVSVQKPACALQIVETNNLSKRDFRIGMWEQRHLTKEYQPDLKLKRKSLCKYIRCQRKTIIENQGHDTQRTWHHVLENATRCYISL